jgi:hypothetical protein
MMKTPQNRDSARRCAADRSTPTGGPRAQPSPRGMTAPRARPARRCAHAWGAVQVNTIIEEDLTQVVAHVAGNAGPAGSSVRPPLQPAGRVEAPGAHRARPLNRRTRRFKGPTPPAIPTSLPLPALASAGSAHPWTAWSVQLAPRGTRWPHCRAATTPCSMSSALPPTTSSRRRTACLRSSGIPIRTRTSRNAVVRRLIPILSPGSISISGSGAGSGQ